MNVSINLLPDDLRRRSIRTQVIRRWTPVLLVVAAGIAAMTYYDWTQCSVVMAEADQLQPEAQAAEQTLLSLAESEKRTEELKTAIAEMNALKPAQDPLKLLNIVSRCATDIGDQLTVSRLDLFSHEDNTEARDSAVPTTAEISAAELPQKRFKTVMQINGLAVSDISIARFMNSLRAGECFHSVALKSSQPSGASEFLQREFVVECVREEQR